MYHVVTIATITYAKFLKTRLKLAIKTKMTNARPYTDNGTDYKNARLNVSHPLYSPDNVPNDHHVFGPVKGEEILEIMK